ncbi:hypothetical protein CEXT_83621 [Caerostris extrusa]|uniref:Uncharacterized protein n=1 Tax=Caerostris extrusa TaxID=172846 RepID=A0AAV4PNP2_CAEEX|nr:hypothetical protein CEXT_83621 [Caerostris extrusa]
MHGSSNLRCTHDRMRGRGRESAALLAMSVAVSTVRSAARRSASCRHRMDAHELWKDMQRDREQLDEKLSVCCKEVFSKCFRVIWVVPMKGFRRFISEFESLQIAL